MENQNEVKVLLVEDDKLLRDICTKKLEKRGITVIQAIEGEIALDLIRKEDVKMVLLDIVLPGIDGFEVLRRIRESEDEKIKNIPIIMLTNLGQDSDVEKAMELGANEFLIKAHFTTSEIAEKIQKFIE